ncbi:MAG: hypothetical protein BWY65_01973 [Firmicutes bacterium ADurb.Bin373]|nr:MAG: hypothetical protein BWY65_01973 [Firmicutes bacterium ADurb.Bin373]
MPAIKQIKITGCKMSEALAHIGALEGLGPKDRGCLRLLTGGMFSMGEHLLETDTLDFALKGDGGRYTLGVVTKRVDTKTFLIQGEENEH